MKYRNWNDFIEHSNEKVKQTEAQWMANSDGVIHSMQTSKSRFNKQRRGGGGGGGG